MSSDLKIDINKVFINHFPTIPPIQKAYLPLEPNNTKIPLKTDRNEDDSKFRLKLN